MLRPVLAEPCLCFDTYVTTYSLGKLSRSLSQLGPGSVQAAQAPAVCLPKMERGKRLVFNLNRVWEIPHGQHWEKAQVTNADWQSKGYSVEADSKMVG